MMCYNCEAICDPSQEVGQRFSKNNLKEIVFYLQRFLKKCNDEIIKLFTGEK